MEKKFFVYLRQSKKDNSEYTFDVQRLWIHSFAKRVGIDLKKCGVEIMENVSWYGEAKREGFENMMESLREDAKKDERQRQYAGIFFFNASRLSRNQRDFVLIENLMKEGYKIFSATEHIMDSPAWMYFFRMIQVESVYFSDRQSSKSATYLVHTTSENPKRFNGGRGLQFGYEVVDGQYRVNPEEAEIVRKIFKLRLQGFSLETIERELDGDVPNNRPLSDETEDSVIEGYELDDESAYVMGRMDEEGRIVSDAFQPPEKNKRRTPDLKMISYILNGNGKLKYDGRRQLSVELRFNEDAEAFNRMIEFEKPRYRVISADGKLKKGWNVIEFEVPELRIVDSSDYEKIAKAGENRLIEKMKKDGDRYEQIYKPFARCACGERMIAKMEGERRYYRCSWAVNGTGCHRTSRLEEGAISDFIKTEILPFITLREGDDEFKNVIEWLIRGQLETLNYQIRTETGHITNFESGLKDATNADLAESYRNKIRDKELSVETLKGRRDALKGMNIWYLSEFFRNAEDFSTLTKFEKSVFLPFFLKTITLDEIHEEGFLYVHPHNRKSKPYQKIVSALELEPYFQELFILNRYHDGTS